MKKLISSVLLFAVLALPVNISNAEGTNELNNLESYEQAINYFEDQKNQATNSADLSTEDKEVIRETNYEMLHNFVDGNDLEPNQIENLMTILEDTDALMYNLDAERGNVDFGSNSEGYSPDDEEEPTFSINSWSGKGDILISLTAKTKGFPHGHAAILSTTSHYVYEALPSPGVIHQRASTYWSTVNDEGQYYVKGAPDSAYTKAANYAKKQVGKPYKLKTTLNNTSEWYCSKLVYKAWLDAGYHVGTLDAYAGIVLPESIRMDFDTVKYKSNPY